MGQRFALSAGTFIIGRESDADLSLPDDAGLSRVHAKIVADGEHYKIIDNESRNGTLVNDKPVRSIHLFDGDIVRIGSSTLRFSQASARRPPEPTAVIHQDALARPPRAPPGPTAPIPAPRAPAIAPWIAAVAGAGALVLVLTAVTVGIFIGRSNSTDASIAPKAEPAKTEAAKAEPAKTEPAEPAHVEPANIKAAQIDPDKSEAATSESAKAEPVWVAARFVAGVDDVVRLKIGGKVESVDVKDGDTVEKGAQLAIVVGVGASAADIATRKESIAALESVAESNERAAKQLAEEKTELQKLLGQTTKLKVVSPASGRVQQLGLAPGDTVRSGQVIARIVGAPARVEVDIAASVAAALAEGAACELQLKSASQSAPQTAKGTLLEKRKNAADVTLSIEPASGDAQAADAKNVVKARCFGS